jgi:hypothetical protein|tara:strand:+ start:241 stop:552 length:312 start_codon:yes stop_codon:yes gene_type:complete
MATKIGEDTNVQLDLKTIGIIIAGTISLASMWFTLQSDISELQNKIDNFSGDEFVQQMEFKFKDELIRSNIVTIDKLTENIKEDVEENKEAIKDLEDKVYKKR